MANQSLVSVPANVEDPLVLRRFLARLVEQLDIVLGNRAGPAKQYVDQLDLVAVNDRLVVALNDAMRSLELALDQVQVLTEEETEELNKAIEALQDKDIAQDLRLDDIENLNSQQNTRLGAIELVNSQQSTRLDNIDILNNQQNTRLTNLENAGHITGGPNDGQLYGWKDGAWVVIP